MIIWSGWGCLVPIISSLSFFIVILIVSVLPGDPENNAVFAFATASFLAAFIVHLLSRKLDSVEPQRLIDPKTGKEVWIRADHTFWFISLNYWRYIFIFFGGIFMLTFLASMLGY